MALVVSPPSAGALEIWHLLMSRVENPALGNQPHRLVACYETAAIGNVVRQFVVGRERLPCIPA
jgi:hypothetical protein